MIKRTVKNLAACLYLYSGLAFLSAVFLQQLLLRRKKVLILMYHGVAEKELLYADNVPLARFQRQVEYLRRCYEITGLDQALDYLNGTYRPQKPLVVLTFDDGYEGVFAHVSPRFCQAGIRGITFLPTRHIGSAGDWERAEKGYKGKIMNWEMLKQLVRDKAIEIGSHGITHRKMSALSRAEALQELQGSKEAIEKKLGIQVRFFAYPYGQARECTRTIKELVQKAGYAAACSTIWGRHSGKDDIYALRRLRVDYDDSLFEFKLKLWGGYDWLEAVHLLKGMLRK